MALMLMHPDPSSETASVPIFHSFIRLLRQGDSVSAIDDGHVPYVVALTGGRREVVQPFDLFGAQFDAVGAGVQRLTFEPMRSLFLDLVSRNVTFGTLADSKTWIAALPDSSKAIKKPSKALVASVTDTALRDLLLALYDATVAQLRNRVVHKDAYRPTRDEAQDALLQARRILHPPTTRLRIFGDAEWYLNGANH